MCSFNNNNVSAHAKKLKPSKTSELPGTYCNCPVECESVIYTQEVSQAERIEASVSPLIGKMNQKTLALGKLQEKIDNATDEGKTGKAEKLKKIRDEVIQYSSIVHFSFKERGIVQYSREQLYTIMDVIGKSSFYDSKVALIVLCLQLLLAELSVFVWDLVYYQASN